MERKRVLLDVPVEQHTRLIRKARAANQTLANFIRTALGLPLEYQGRRTVRQRQPKEQA